MTNRLACLLATANLLAACGSDDDPGNEQAVVDYAAEAPRIAQSSIIVDTHIDVPMKLAMGGGDFSPFSKQKQSV